MTVPALVPPWPRPAVSVMVFHDDRVLLGQRAKPPLRGVWSLPGGRIEPGETVEVAGLRELAEETGVAGKIIGHAGSRDVIQHDADGVVAVHYVITVLVARWVSGVPCAASDCLDARWTALDNLQDLELTAGTADLIRSTWTQVADQFRMGTRP